MLPVTGSIEKYFREKIRQLPRVLAVLISRLCTADGATLVVFRGSLLHWLWNTAVLQVFQGSVLRVLPSTGSIPSGWYCEYWYCEYCELEPGIDITLPYTYPPKRYDISIVLSQVLLAGIRYYMIFYIISYHIAIYRPFQQYTSKYDLNVICDMVYDKYDRYQVIYRPISGDLCDPTTRYEV